MLMLPPWLQRPRRLLMTLAGWFLPFLWSTVRLSVGSLRVWSKPQSLLHGQPLAVRRDCSPSQATPHVPCPKVPLGTILILALVACLLAGLVLGLPDGARSITAEAMSPLRAMTLGSGPSPVLRLAEVRPLITLIPLASPPEAISTLDDSDADNDEPLANPLLTLGAHVLPDALVGISLNASPYTHPWPLHYIARPQLLKRP